MPAADDFIDTEDDGLRGRRAPLVLTKPHLFVVLEGARPLAGGARYSLDDIDEVVIGRGSDREATRADRGGCPRLTLRLPSPSLSREHAILRHADDGWQLEDAGSKNGSYVNGIRVRTGVVTPNDILELGHAFLVIRSFAQRLGDDVPDVDGCALEDRPLAFRTLVPTLDAGLAEVRRIAASSVPVLLWGETGTGKEVLARAIHELSGRRGPFVAVNCSTLTDGLAGSQLFGHIKGAFSGAVASSVGYVRMADKGTLLLDEVGDLNAAAQGALLRVLQEREVVPVGRASPQSVDVRVVATTPRALHPAVSRDQFRSDLFARLSGFVHHMTPLRERREDLGLLVAALLRKAGVGARDNPRLAPETGLQLMRHGWPLNVRELEQTLVRSWLLADGGPIHAKDLAFNPEEPRRHTPEPPPATRARALSDQDKEMQKRLAEALAASQGNVSQAARALGKGRVQMHRLMRRLEVDPKTYRS